MKTYKLVELGEMENGTELENFFNTEYGDEVRIIVVKDLEHEIDVCKQIINDCLFDGDTEEDEMIKANRRLIDILSKAIEQCKEEKITAMYIGKVEPLHD